jgi:hypothetical protein
VAEWLLEQLNGERRVLVGIDHGFSFPLKYFQKHNLPLDWPLFLEDFLLFWPTDREYVLSIRQGYRGDYKGRSGNSKWRRLTEVRVGAKSVFHFDVPGSVATATHAGLPWLLHIREHAKKDVHFWPFDGWEIPPNTSVIAEAYPALCSHNFPREGRTSDQHDAYSLAAWMRQCDWNGSLIEYFEPNLLPEEREVAEIEGWILGVR